MPTNIEVFISYSHDSQEHETRVRALAERLRDEGIHAMIDQYQTVPPEGWQLWMEKQIRHAKFVLLVCTEIYLRRVMKEEMPGKGLGVMWEASIIYSHLYDTGGVNTKFIPVLFESEDTQFIPGPLRPTTRYNVSTDSGYDLLYRRLTDQPATPPGPVGTRRVLPPLPRPNSASHRTATAPNLVHPYPLQANFTGRESERRELTAWLSDEEHPLYELVAMGGMGKSALSWYWLTHDVLPTADKNLDGVMWWSFYEPESSFAKFVDDALKYVSGQPIDTAKFPATYDRTQELRKQLQTKRVLFVLDGFERQLRDYAGFDRAYRPDHSSSRPGEARACVDPNAARLLVHIAAATTRSKVLITTRLPVSDLQDRAGEALAGVVEKDLGELHPDDAVAFMYAQGVSKGTFAEIATECADYGYHPLSLRLLSGLLKHDARMPGDIATAPRHNVHASLIQRQHHVLQQSYDALPKRERALISRIAAFRSSVSYEALAIFNTLGSQKRFEEALEDLRIRGLLQRDIERNRYDLHPIVRHYAYDRLTDKVGVHTKLMDYFATIAPLPNNEIQNIEDLAPVIELYHHTVCSGRYDEASMLLFERLFPRPLHFPLGAYQLMIELTTSLFPDGEDTSPRVEDEAAQAWIINSLGVAYGASGKSRKATLLFGRHVDISRKLKDPRNIAVGLGNLATDQLLLGELAAAEHNLGQEFTIFGALKSEADIVQNRTTFAQVPIYEGDFEAAKQVLELAEQSAQKRGYEQTLGIVESLWAERALLMGNPAAAFEFALKARKLAEVDHIERDIIAAECLLGTALVRVGNDLEAAATHLNDALTRCRRINLLKVEPDILLGLAQLHRARGDYQEAKVNADEALAIADRCEYRLKQADVHNFLSRLNWDAGNHQAALEHAEIAKGRAWCDGPPHCYKPALDEAEAILLELGKPVA
jgi:tetratricopeptide (TPR) repeat protein